MGLINIFKFRNWAVNFELKYCYGTLRIWRSGPKVLNTEISVFGRLSVNHLLTDRRTYTIRWSRIKIQNLQNLQFLHFLHLFAFFEFCTFLFYSILLFIRDQRIV